jgi:DNA repair exonuclease SbcCD ATPase subunit
MGMLDTVRRMGELRDLVSAAKQEREALTAAIATLTVKKRSIDEAIDTLAQTQKLTQTVSSALDRVTTRLDAVEERARTLSGFDDRVNELSTQVAESQRTASQLLGPDGELAKHQVIAEQLSSQEVAARANIEMIRKERQALEDMREQLRHAGSEVREAADRFTAVKTDFDQIRSMGTQLGQDYARMRDTSKDARDLAQQALEAAKETETRVASLRTLDDLAKTARERINTLNVLVEHVTQKARTMEAQKQIVEHAIVESNRLSEMVWNMDTQIAKLTDGMRQITQAETVVDRLAKAGTDASHQLELANKSRDSSAPIRSRWKPNAGSSISSISASLLSRPAWPPSNRRPMPWRRATGRSRPCRSRSTNSRRGQASSARALRNSRRSRRR